MFVIFSIDKCKFMDSKKRPLYLVWVDEEEGTQNHIIYKNGDGKLDKHMQELVVRQI